MIVADVNLIAYLVWSSDHSAAADAVWARDAVWVAPPIWLPELRSALGAAVRRGACPLDGAVAVIDRAVASVGDAPSAVPSRLVLDLSRRSGCSTYDCEYVALAVTLGSPLVTSDKAVLRAFPNVAISPAEFATANP